MTDGFHFPTLSEEQVTSVHDTAEAASSAFTLTSPFLPRRCPDYRVLPEGADLAQCRAAAAGRRLSNIQDAGGQASHHRQGGHRGQRKRSVTPTSLQACEQRRTAGCLAARGGGGHIRRTPLPARNHGLRLRQHPTRMRESWLRVSGASRSLAWTSRRRAEAYEFFPVIKVRCQYSTVGNACGVLVSVPSQ